MEACELKIWPYFWHWCAPLNLNLNQFQLTKQTVFFRVFKIGVDISVPKNCCESQNRQICDAYANLSRFPAFPFGFVESGLLYLILFHNATTVCSVNSSMHLWHRSAPWHPGISTGRFVNWNPLNPQNSTAKHAVGSTASSSKTGLDQVFGLAPGKQNCPGCG